jgi:hypothetical protein
MLKPIAHLYFFMLLLCVLAVTASRHQGVQVVITNTSLSDASLFKHLVVASLTLCTSDGGKFHNVSNGTTKC